ncbi:BCCT family transporter [Staphylococcus aureus]
MKCLDNLFILLHKIKYRIEGERINYEFFFTRESKWKKYSPVLHHSAIVVAIVVLLGAFLPEQFNYVTNNIKMWITEKLGWYYLILTTIIVFFCIFLIFSPIGKLTR